MTTKERAIQFVNWVNGADCPYSIVDDQTYQHVDTGDTIGPDHLYDVFETLHPEE